MSPKLSYPMIRTLTSLKRYGYLPLTNSMSAAGGATQTVGALLRRDLIRWDPEERVYVLTPAGIEAIS